MKLNIGCGHKKYPKSDEWINTDIVLSVGPDIIFNLEDGIPFANNSIELIYIDNVLEHINNIYIVFSEISRVLKDEGKCIIKVPHYRSYNAFTDPTHKRFFTTKTFRYLVDNHKYYKQFEQQNKLKIKRIKIKYAGGFFSIIKFFVEPIANLFPEIFERYFFIPPEEIEVVLEKV